MTKKTKEEMKKEYKAMFKRYHDMITERKSASDTMLMESNSSLSDELLLESAASFCDYLKENLLGAIFFLMMIECITREEMDKERKVIETTFSTKTLFGMGCYTKWYKVTEQKKS